jgi:hypothetical protein
LVIYLVLVSQNKEVLVRSAIAGDGGEVGSDDKVIFTIIKGIDHLIHQ